MRDADREMAQEAHWEARFEAREEERAERAWLMQERHDEHVRSGEAFERKDSP